MARISGVDLPRDKRVEIGLTYIYGIGRKTSNDILAATGVNPDTRVRDLTEEDISKLREYIDHNCRVEGDLRRDIAFDIKRLIEIGCYRGIRVATEESVTAQIFPFADSVQRQTLVQERVRERLWQTRRSNQGGITDGSSERC